MKYAVIRFSGKQFRVEDGDEILVETSVTEKLVKPEVLMMVEEEKVSIGTPTLDDKHVSLKFLGEEKGEKIHVRKFKAKSRYRKHIGSRPSYKRYSIHITL